MYHRLSDASIKVGNCRINPVDYQTENYITCNYLVKFPLIKRLEKMRRQANIGEKELILWYFNERISQRETAKICNKIYSTIGNAVGQ